ncbi:hypothetical protein [Allofranklinella schreckenbergeri]|uniref:hypothetical protein n=1 Tax=Allofranklinella schreckenbergeri TaxID=1076744 RepID=UPI001EED5FCB|nr:hypothetical protein [Allofranklinella schreckenbergeri]
MPFTLICKSTNTNGRLMRPLVLVLMLVFVLVAMEGQAGDFSTATHHPLNPRAY